MVCYESARPEASLAVVSPVENPPVEACAELWREGHMGEGRWEGHDGVPPLASCLNDGLVGVFPGDSGTCGRLGLRPVPEPTGEDRQRAVAARTMVDELGRRLSERCVGTDEAVRITRELFAAYGMTDWKVRTRPVFFQVLEAVFGPRNPCTSLVAPVNEREQTVILS